MSKNFTFNNAPAIQMRRSRISGLSYGVNTSLSMGKIYPCYVEEILPGDTFKVKTDMVARLSSSFIKPIYGNLFVDVFYFFVPWRLVYEDFPCVFGENKTGYWKNQDEYFVPTTPANQTVVSKSIADYLEMPLGTVSAPINILYHRANALVWNEWFRDENHQEPVYIHKGAFHSSEALNSNEWSPQNYTGMCPPISKYRDYFTSVLPSPQKGGAVELPLDGQIAPVYAQAVNNPIPPVGSRSAMRFYDVFNSVFGTGDTVYNFGVHATNQTRVGDAVVNISSNGTGAFDNLAYDSVAPINLGADLSGITLGTVNDLRLAFQTQKILERDALGTRYVEHILNTFGVSNPDGRMQRPELLNASRFPLNIQQVASTNGESSLAQLGAYSLSKGGSGFSKAFSEYGCILGYVAIRQYHNYQNGLPKRYTRTKRLDYYNPALAYIGFMPVKSTEIFASAPESDIFGYQRAWSEYRHHQNAVSGQMRSNAENSLDIWNIADDYENQPVASDEFIRETPLFLDNAITIQSEVQDQFIFDIWHNVDAIRVMPANPMPGLIDHY